MRGSRRAKNIFKVLVGWSCVGEYDVIGVGGRPLYIGTVDFQIRRSYYSSQERLEFRLETFCIL